jgi:hypothetical protein
MGIGKNGREEDRMDCKFIAMAALAVALVPGAAMAQSKTAKDTSPSRHYGDSSRVTSATATGDVAGPGGEVTAAMLKAQQDPNIIGTPAWWKTHATADGKPMSEARKP